MPDLTRFDFHAVRFMNSEDVEEMTASEVGQYILLLCKAWLMGKDTTLPDDREKLSRYAKVSEVSDAVLTHFPVVETEWGPRRRNNVLYGEWMDACLRSDRSRDKANKRWTPLGVNPPVDATADATAPATASATAMQATMPNSVHTRPDQPNSVQSNPSQVVFGHDESFRIFKRKFRELIGTNLGGDKKTQAEYAKHLQTYGHDVIMECLDDWAKKSGEWAATAKYPAFAFWKALPGLAETAMDVVLARKEETAAAVTAAEEKRRADEFQEASVERQIKEFVAFREERPVQNEESMSDFLEGLNGGTDNTQPDGATGGGPAAPDDASRT